MAQLRFLLHCTDAVHLDLIGRYGSNPVAVTLFGINLVAISLTTQWIFLYAAGHNLMSDAVRSAHDERAARVVR